MAGGNSAMFKKLFKFLKKNQKTIKKVLLKILNGDKKEKKEQQPTPESNAPPAATTYPPPPETMPAPANNVPQSYAAVSQNNESTPPPAQQYPPPTNAPPAQQYAPPPTNTPPAQQYPPPTNAPPAQQYAPPPTDLLEGQAVFQTSSIPEPTKRELGDIAMAIEKLWELDTNRLTPGKDFDLNLQSSTYVSNKQDRASEPLFSNVDVSVLQRIPTVNLFHSLLDNYNPHTGEAEETSQHELNEQRKFIDACMTTKPILYLYKYLESSGKSPVKSLDEFKKLLHSIWFSLYKRQARDDSSAFEHAFVGEIRDGKVTGFHNWVQFYCQEKKGNADYRGYIKPRSKNQNVNENMNILSIQLEWHGEIKPVSTFIFGSSPEFELAMYSLCYFMDTDQVNCTLGDVEVCVKVHTFQNRVRKQIGGCYIETR